MISAATSSDCRTRAREPGLAVVHRRHPIEQMRRLTRAGGDRREGFVVTCAGMSERHAVAALDQVRDELEATLEFWSERNDTDVWRRPLDLAQDIGAAKSPAGLGRAQSRVRRPQAFHPLRTGKGRADEVAFNMRRQNPRRPGGRCSARADHLREHACQPIRLARHRGRAEGGDAEPRQR